MEEVEVLGAEGPGVGVWKREQPWTLPLVSSQGKHQQSPALSLRGGGKGSSPEPVLGWGGGQESGLDVTASV